MTAGGWVTDFRFSADQREGIRRVYARDIDPLLDEIERFARFHIGREPEPSKAMESAAARGITAKAEKLRVALDKAPDDVVDRIEELAREMGLEGRGRLVNLVSAIEGAAWVTMTETENVPRGRPAGQEYDWALAIIAAEIERRDDTSTAAVGALIESVFSALWPARTFDAAHLARKALKQNVK